MSFHALDREFDEVVIIDLLSPLERSAWRISEDLSAFFASKELPSFQLSCFEKNHVSQALAWCISRAATHSSILHIVAHGNQSGIGLKHRNELLTWDELRLPLQTLNHKMSGHLILNLTSCEGFNGTAIQDLQDLNEPFFGIIGPLAKIEFNVAKRVNEAFYQGLLNGEDIPMIVETIDTAEGGNVIWCRSSQYRPTPSSLSL